MLEVASAQAFLFFGIHFTDAYAVINDKNFVIWAYILSKCVIQYRRLLL